MSAAIHEVTANCGFSSVDVPDEHNVQVFAAIFHHDRRLVLLLLFLLNRHRIWLGLNRLWLSGSFWLSGDSFWLRLSGNSFWLRLSGGNRRGHWGLGLILALPRVGSDGGSNSSSSDGGGP